LREQKTDEDTFLTERKARAGPVLDKFKGWLLKRKDEAPPSLLYEEGNSAFCIRAEGLVILSKRWGAESSCGMFTLIETAKQNGLITFEVS
jgi:hypothetical protein